MAKTLNLQEFWHSPARQLLAYPSGDAKVLARRWAELQTFGLEAMYAHGPATLAGLEVLGVGYCGVAMGVRHRGHDRVLKVRRAPAPQESLQAEAKMLSLANAVGVGPQYISHSDNFLLMDYVDGPVLVAWLQTSPSAEAVRGVVFELIHQAYRLDQTGVDHGDLRCITDHGLVQSTGPVLIDFSGASLNRRPANVTTLVQGLLISTRIAQLLAPWFPQVHKADLIEHLRHYKHQPSSMALSKLFQYLELERAH